MADSELRHADLALAIERLELAVERHTRFELPPLQSLAAMGQESDQPTLRLLASLVHELGPRHVIEFGSGVSTELLALLGFDRGRMALTTFEHDPWAARELLSLSNPFAINYRWFAFCLCPLVARLCGEDVLPVYDDGMTTPTVPYPADLLIVKGPPRELGGRAGTIHQALGYSRPGTLLLLLDIRPEEQTMLESWTSNLAAHPHFIPPGLLGRHLAFIVKERLEASFILERPHAQAMTWRENPDALQPTGAV